MVVAAIVVGSVFVYILIAAGVYNLRNRMITNLSKWSLRHFLPGENVPDDMMNDAWALLWPGLIAFELVVAPVVLALSWTVWSLAWAMKRLSGVKSR